MPNETEITLPVQSRPARLSWMMVVMPGILALFFLTGLFDTPKTPPIKPPSTSEVVTTIVFCGAIGIACLVLAVWCALWIQRGVIIADEAGLHWRSVGKWKHATWPQVRNYHNDTTNRKRAMVETDAGTLTIWREWMNNVDALCDAIQQNAKWARAKEWGVLGTRAEADWPRTFRYNPAEHLSASRIFSGIAVLWFSAFAWGFFRSWKAWAEIWEYSSPAIAVVCAAFYFACSLLSPLFACMVISTLRETQARIAERITVSTSGLIFENDTQRIECAWDEVTDYYRDSMLRPNSGDDRYVIVTPNGNFDFTLIENRFLLRKIIQRHAKNALYEEWRDYKPQQETGEKGERLYTYRTRENRAVMLLPMSFIPISLIMASSNIELGNPGATDDLSLKIMLGFYGLVSAILCAAYFIGSIEISENGITQRGLKGKKFLSWPDITQIRGTKMGGYELIGSNTRLGFSGMIGDFKTLHDEIERRAINAEVLPSWAQQSPDNGT